MPRSRVALILAFAAAFAATLLAQEKPRWEALLELARSQANAGEAAQAEQTYKAAYSEAQTVAEPYALFLVADGLGRLYGQQNRLDELEALYRQGLSTLESKHHAYHPHVAHWLTEFGTVLAHVGKSAEAEQVALRALAIYEAQPAPAARNAQGPLRFLVRLYNEQGRAEEAASLAGRIVENARQHVDDAKVRFGETHPAVAGSATMLARAYSDAGQYAQAEAELLRAIEIYESSVDLYPELQIAYSGALRQLGRLHAVLGREESSRALEAKAETLLAEATRYERSPSH